jgi:YidC/Oxa1 family membrane protein insertase
LIGAIGNLFNLIFTDPIFNALMVLYRLLGDFGLAIVFLTIIIKLILIPLTLQQLKSMKANQELQPLMAEIRKKYANNKQEQMLRTQALYKEKGFNPAAGCLPLFIQLPVLYGLFFAFEAIVSNKNLTVAAVNSRLYPFIPPFVNKPDIQLTWLAFLDHLFHIQFFVFSLGKPDPTHILPILAGLATFVQLRMSQARNMAPTTGNAKDPTAQSMKMMQYAMPLITVFFGWTFPAGLALYWVVSYGFQAIQQYFVTGWGGLMPAKDGAKTGTGTISANATKTNSSKVVDATVAKPRSIEPAIATNGASGAKSNGGSVNNRARTNTRSNGSSNNNNHRQRGSSASARRRSGAQRSRG